MLLGPWAIFLGPFGLVPLFLWLSCSHVSEGRANGVGSSGGGSLTSCPYLHLTTWTFLALSSVGGSLARFILRFVVCPRILGAVFWVAWHRVSRCHVPPLGIAPLSLITLKLCPKFPPKVVKSHLQHGYFTLPSGDACFGVPTAFYIDSQILGSLEGEVIEALR